MWSTPDAGNGQRTLERERVRVAEVEAVEPLGDDDRVAAVGVKYMLYGSSTGIGGPGLPVSDRSASGCFRCRS